MTLADEAATERLGQRLAESVSAGDVITLDGPLGSGKTVLARAFIRTLSGDAVEVPSPTFTLVQTYDVDRGMIWHLDLYRLRGPDEVWELGFEDALADFAVIIEWPERLGGYIPTRRLDIVIAAGDGPNERVATLVVRGGSDLLRRSGIGEAR